MTRKQNTGLTGNFLLCRQYLIAKRHSYLAWRLPDLCFVPAKMSQLVPNWQWTSTCSKCTLWPVDWWKCMEIYGKRWGVCGGITLNIKKNVKKKHVLAILWVLNLGPSFPLSKQQPVKARLGVTPVAISAAFGIATSHYTPRIKEEHVNWERQGGERKRENDIDRVQERGAANKWRIQEDCVFTCPKGNMQP